MTPLASLNEAGRITLIVNKNGSIGIGQTDFDLAATALALQKMATHLINNMGFVAQDKRQNGARAPLAS